MFYRPIRLFVAIGIGVLLAPTTLAIAESDSSESSAVVVLELFTSQGCSSCPPADELLTQINNLGVEHDLPVICLSFHVDYWNSLGWKDPYSQAQFSERQRLYARRFKSRSVYTPQLIVDGREEFVGSKASAAREAIRTALKRPSQVQVDLKAKWLKDRNAVSIAYALQGPIDNELMNVAIVQKQGSNEVPRGENAGRALSHVNIVRHFETVRLKRASGELSVEMPKGLAPGDARVAAFVQNSKSANITGAAIVDIQSRKVR